MTIPAHEQLKRVIQIIPRLADDQGHSIAELAQEIGMSPKALFSLLTAIADRYDVPGGFVSGLGIYIEEGNVSVMTNHLLRPMRLMMRELCALELGLSMLRREKTLAEQAPIDRALERLRAAISDLPSNESHAGVRHAELDVQGSIEHLNALRSAHRSGHKVRLLYRSGRSSEASERTICPHALVFAEQMWYVVAMCDDTVVRFFRLDRVEDVTPLEETFEHDSSTLEQVMERGKPFFAETERRMTVRYSPRVARWVAEREGKELEPDGSLTMEHPVADDSWAVRHVLQYGPEAEIIGPPEMREMIGQRLTGLATGALL
jgi:proteasome accessory factor C